MKKILTIFLILFVVIGCSNIKNFEYEEIIEKSIANNKVGGLNQYRTGYKYYLPRKMTIVNKDDFNEIAHSDNNVYYIYIDLVSYYNKVKEPYKVDKNAYYSKTLKYGEFDGYLEINKENDYYLIEIMYNYAKIEVIVEKSEIEVAISNAINILTSIEYNDEIIKNLMEDDILKFNEIEFNIFETKKDIQSNYLTAVEEYGQYEEPVHDSDLIN